jgi:putative nucleotidyltransferase with HDIG domain
VDPRSKYQTFLVQYHAGVARDLPIISPYARELAETPRRRTPTLSAITRAFETDPFLAAKLTGTSNSIFFAHDHRLVLTVREALSRVGLKYALNLVWAAPPLPPDVELSQTASLWTHCMTVAHVARSVATRVVSAPLQPQVAHLVAMIHDIGYLLQFSYSASTLSDIAIRLEDEESGQDNDAHAAQGEELARFWSLPIPAIEAIRGHHDPHRCPTGTGRWLAMVIAGSESCGPKLCGFETSVCGLRNMAR